MDDPQTAVSLFDQFLIATSSGAAAFTLASITFIARNYIHDIKAEKICKKFRSDLREYLKQRPPIEESKLLPAHPSSRLGY